MSKPFSPTQFSRRFAISRIENYAEDIKLSTLKKFAQAPGKELSLQVI